MINKVSDELGELAPDDLADIVLPEVEDIRFKRISNADHQHDITELAFLRAHKVLQERQTVVPFSLFLESCGGGGIGIAILLRGNY